MIRNVFSYTWRNFFLTKKLSLFNKIFKSVKNHFNENFQLVNSGANYYFRTDVASPDYCTLPDPDYVKAPNDNQGGNSVTALTLSASFVALFML